MTDEDGAASIEEVEEEQTDLVAAIGEATHASARKEDASARATRTMRNVIKLLIGVVLILVVAYVGTLLWAGNEFHQYNDRAGHNEKLLLCMAGGQRTFTKDLRTLITSKGKAPAKAYYLAPECQIIP